MLPVLHPCGRPANSREPGTGNGEPEPSLPVPCSLFPVAAFTVAVVLAAMAGPAPGAEADAPAAVAQAAAAPTDEQVLAARRMMFDAARGPDRVKAGEALIDALLEATEARVQARAHPEALALAQRALVTAILIKSPRRPWIEGRVKALGETARAAREAEDLKKQLQAKPQDAAAREKLVRLFLVTLDDPAEAAQHLEGVADESLRKYVPAAAKGVEAAPDLARLTLGEWYQGLAEAALPGAKAAMLVRARAYYQGFLAVHTADDMDRAKAVLALQKVEGDLDAAAPPAPPSPFAAAEWIDLLLKVDTAKDAVSGKWRRRNAALGGGEGQCARLVIPVEPQGNYEVEVKFIRTTGDDMVGIVLPVGTTQVVVNLGGYHGTASGLEFVGGQRCSANETKVATVLENDRSYAAAIRVQVRGQEAEVSVGLDGRPLIRYKGPVASLTLPTWFKLSSGKSLGLVTWESGVTFESARLRMLSGEAKMLRPQGAAGPEKP